MRLIQVVTRAKDRPYLTIGLCVAGFLLVWYLLTLLVAHSYLSAYPPYPTGQPYDDGSIILDDALLSTVTPKLRQELLDDDANHVLLSSLEYNQINGMLASTEMGK